MPTLKITEANLYPPGLRRLLELAPGAGNGLNKWVIRAATALQGYASYDKAMPVTDAHDCGRTTRTRARREIRRALDRVLSFSGAVTPRAARVEPDSFPLDQSLFTGTTKKAHTNVVESSPNRMRSEPSARWTAQILRVLFPGNPFLVFGVGDRYTIAWPWTPGSQPTAASVGVYRAL